MEATAKGLLCNVIEPLFYAIYPDLYRNNAFESVETGTELKY